MRTLTKGPVQNHPILVNLKNVAIQATLGVPADAKGLVVLLHPASAAQMDSTGQMLAESLRNNRFATVSVDLLTFDEDRALRMKIDSRLLRDRLTGVLNWVRTQEDIAHLPIGVYAPPLAAVAVFDTAAMHPVMIQAIVSRSAYLHAEEPALNRVTCPTLLIAGESDLPFIRASNKSGYRKLKCMKKLSIVPDAADAAPELTANWFAYYLGEDSGQRVAA